jgi:drug/metabolite transporter (DMT)-like permease
MVSVVPLALRIATAVIALAVAVVAAVDAARDRPPRRTTLYGTGVLILAALALVCAAIASLASGHHASSATTFVIYLVAFVAFPIAALVMARMEPTRWGSVIIAAAGLIEAILVVRLDQVWTGI